MKRRLFMLMLFLLLGAVVNVAVAWGCALTVDLGNLMRSKLLTSTFRILRVRGEV